ncbi:S9 family peptidase [Aurantivibrio plasticivorans]
MTEVKISPNGKYIASINSFRDKEVRGSYIQLMNLDTKESKPLYFTDNTENVIKNVRWANNEFLMADIVFIFDKGSYNRARHNYVKININSGKFENIVPLHKTPGTQTGLYVFHDDPGHVIMGFQRNWKNYLYKVSIDDGRFEQHFGSFDDGVIGSYGWGLDYYGEVRTALRYRDRNVQVHVKNASTGKWFEFARYKPYTDEVVIPGALDSDLHLFYFKKYHEGRLAVFSVDLRESENTERLVYAHPTMDVSGRFYWSVKNKSIVGVDVVGGEGSTVYWDEKFKAIQKIIDNAMPHTRNYILNEDYEENRFIVLARNDIEPGAYFLFDQNAKKLDLIGRRKSKLMPEDLSRFVKHTFTARDGEKIDTFVSMPKSENATKLPMVVVPQPGMFTFNYVLYDDFVQYLSGEGYAVASFNTRGSFGYGFEFMNQGMGQWGTKNAEDIEDGVDWLIKQGVADKDKVCIVGNGEGGYAAMMGMVKTPELFTCGVGIYGIYNLQKYTKGFRQYPNFSDIYGDYFTDLDDVSPINFVDDITGGVLIIHNKGSEQGEDMADALKSHNVDSEVIEIDGLDQEFNNYNHRLFMFENVARFLEKYLE